MAAKVVIELSSEEHSFLIAFLREGISAVEAQGSEAELDPQDGEAVMGKVA